MRERGKGGKEGRGGESEGGREGGRGGGSEGGRGGGSEGGEKERFLPVPCHPPILRGPLARYALQPCH